ncbi:PDR/VanB family oxidoreductase [Streptomyces violaceorubidus]
MLTAVEEAGAEWSLLYGWLYLVGLAFTGELARYGRPGCLPSPRTSRDCWTWPPCSTACRRHPRLLLRAEPRGWTPSRRAARPGACAWSGSARREAAAQAAAEAEFEVVLARSGRTVAVPPGVSVLAAVRLKRASRCSYFWVEGSCGTWETEVVEGEPDHRGLGAHRGGAGRRGDDARLCVAVPRPAARAGPLTPRRRSPGHDVAPRSAEPGTHVPVTRRRGRL